MKVLITGASRGIGQAIAKVLVPMFDAALLTATTTDKLLEQQEQWSTQQVQMRALDLGNDESIEILLAWLEAESFWPDVLVNNAGISQDALAVRLSPADWDKVIKVNVSGTFRLTQACFRHMLKKRAGRIINLSSVVAQAGNVGQAHYVSAKAAIEGMTRAMALEGASRGVLVNAVAPGYIETDMTARLSQGVKERVLERIPLRRLGQPEDVAKVVAFLASDAANYMTGQVLHVNGGMYI